MANILLIETSAKACSVALSHDFNIEFNRQTLEGPSHASLLGSYAKEALDYSRENGLAIDAVAVSAGPGSYTGLRIGVSEAKGICFGLGVPLIAVSTLQALCCRLLFAFDDMPDEALLCPMVDARRMEVYTAVYDRALREVEAPSAQIITPTSMAGLLDERPVWFCGDGADKCASVITHPNARFVRHVCPLATDMLALAVRAYAQGDFADVAYFTPFYLKDFMASTPRDLLKALL